MIRRQTQLDFDTVADTLTGELKGNKQANDVVEGFGGLDGLKKF